MSAPLWFLLFFIAAWVLAYHRASLSVWSTATFVGIVLFSYFTTSPLWVVIFWWVAVLSVALPLNLTFIRRRFISRPLLGLYRKVMPKMSVTEQEALQAGTVGWEGEIFSGMPDLAKLLSRPKPKLSEEERGFLDGPVETLCQMTNDWEITHKELCLPAEVWQYLKDHGFFAIIIPKEYGGKGFSAYAHAQIILKLASCSTTLSCTVAVPNSLGPAELLLKYGTDEQKNYYLPRLSRGEEIPCFALTAPEAGSDASSMTDSGVICRGEIDGKEVLGIRLNWNKRYITLAPVATLLGLAFKLTDPEQLLSSTQDYGITCALIPVNTPGISIGRRHFPLNAPFQNGPTQGKDVFIPLDWIIGGVPMAGKGWRMLMECLAAGRAISLPSSAQGNAKKLALASGAYARIRQQFGVSIGQFEGIQEALARITINTYTAGALRTMTVAGLDHGEDSAVASAIAKYHTTELGREVAVDAMDIHGGKGICLGPKNYLGREYQAAPIAITVEGANILTRCLIIFGQGAMRCHPYVFDELNAAMDEDKARGLAAFDKAIFAHIGFAFSNKMRTLFLGLTSGHLTRVPQSRMKRMYQALLRYSTGFALMTDICLGIFGKALKRRELISARLGDILSMLYMLAAVLKQYHDQGEADDDYPVVLASCETLLYRCQTAFQQLLRNLPSRFVAMSLRVLIFPLGAHRKPPTDALSANVAEYIMTPSVCRIMLAEDIYLTSNEGNPVGQMEETLLKVLACESIEKRLKQYANANEINGLGYFSKVDSALSAGVISDEEAERLRVMHKARLEAIAVDDFEASELL